ncbi:MAG: (d)CMP kinase [Stellaceae bacterium]
MIIAVDGPAASGKGTLARHLARHLGLAHLDTGTLYRIVALQALAAGDPADPDTAANAARTLDLSLLEDPRLRDEHVADTASVVAAVPPVRAALIDFQRAFAHRDGGAVLDGRDIGTIICPDADAKIFLTASAETRARRRARELRAPVGGAIYQRVLADLVARDMRDRDRGTAPMVPADDAVVIDTNALDADAVFQAALAAIALKLAARKR